MKVNILVQKTGTPGIGSAKHKIEIFEKLVNKFYSVPEIYVWLFW
jgi:hypothetical protein